MGQSKDILFLGYSGFPDVKEAAVTRILYLSLALNNGGNRVLVVNRKGRAKSQSELPARGEIQGVKYCYANGNARRPSGFIKRNLHKVKGFFGELALMFNSRARKRFDVAFVYTSLFSTALYYRVITKLLGVKMVLNVTEYMSANEEEYSTLTTLNHKLYDRFHPFISDGFLPVSDYLAENILSRKQAKQLKVPPLFDFELMDKYGKVWSDTKEFLFCGSSGYAEIINFIVDSFREASLKNARLRLVISGSEHETGKWKKQLEVYPGLTVVSNLSNDELYKSYKNAFALLIPMRDTLQDKARFPNKTAEYLACGNPMLTTANGEMPNYFHHNENAFIADSYDISAFSRLMRHVCNNSEKAVTVGENGYKTGKEYFNYKSYAQPLNKLMCTL